LPKKKALRATEANIKYFESQRIQLGAHNLKLRTEAEQVAKKMVDIRVTLIRQASEVGQLYGSVRSGDIADAVKAAGYIVERAQVVLSAPIKHLGIHNAKLRLHPEVEVNISVIVAQSEEEAQAKFAVQSEPTAEA
jgi:large subunit ribosomal protein L9